MFKKIGIRSVQITLDGTKETHNRVKYFEGCGDVFETVLRNIERLNTKAPEIEIIIRVNLTKTNCLEYIDLYKMLQERFKGRTNIIPSPAFVLDRGTSNSCSKQSLFSHKERSTFILELTQKYHLDSPFIRYPKPFFNECAIRNDMAISFDPAGYAYKCWEIIGNRNYAIGRLNPQGQLTEINRINFNRQTFGADPLDDPTCSRCIYLPVCHGGCPIQRIENVFEGKHNCTCTPYKGFLDDFLRLHLQLRNAGYDNH